MKRVVLAALLALLAVTKVSAQDYDWALGVRLGDNMSGLSAKKSITASSKIEGVIAFPYSQGINIMGLYQKYMPVIDNGFHLYYGFGAHIGSERYKDHGEYHTGTFFGADGVVGLEYKLYEAPLAFSIDYKPAINLVGHKTLDLAGFAFGIRFTF